MNILKIIFKPMLNAERRDGYEEGVELGLKEAQQEIRKQARKQARQEARQQALQEARQQGQQEARARYEPWVNAQRAAGVHFTEPPPYQRDESP